MIALGLNTLISTVKGNSSGLSVMAAKPHKFASDAKLWNGFDSTLISTVKGNSSGLSVMAAINLQAMRLDHGKLWNRFDSLILI